MKMYDNILQKVSVYQEKRGISYAKPDDKLYKYVKAFYMLAFIYTMFMNVTFALGVSMSETLRATMKAPLYTVLILIVAHIVAFVLTNFKKSIIAATSSFCVNTISCVCLILTFAPLMENEIGGYKTAFYWRHFVPLCILFLINLIINFIVVRANLKTRKTYKKIVENIYNSHSVSAEDSNFTADEWDEILKNI